jgi:hypothetical protein
VAAMLDYRDAKANEMADRKHLHNEEYQRVMPVLISQWQFPVWFLSFIDDLQSFDTSERKSGGALKSKYL